MMYYCATVKYTRGWGDNSAKTTESRFRDGSVQVIVQDEVYKDYTPCLASTLPFLHLVCVVLALPCFTQENCIGIVAKHFLP